MTISKKLSRTEGEGGNSAGVPRPVSPCVFDESLGKSKLQNLVNAALLVLANRLYLNNRAKRVFYNLKGLETVLRAYYLFYKSRDIGQLAINVLANFVHSIKDDYISNPLIKQESSLTNLSSSKSTETAQSNPSPPSSECFSRISMPPTSLPSSSAASSLSSSSLHTTMNGIVSNLQTCTGVAFEDSDDEDEDDKDAEELNRLSCDDRMRSLNVRRYEHRDKPEMDLSENSTSSSNCGTSLKADKTRSGQDPINSANCATSHSKQRCYFRGEIVPFCTDSSHELAQSVDISATALASVICGMLNTGRKSTIYMGIEENGCVEGKRLSHFVRDELRLGVDTIMMLKIQPTVLHSQFAVEFVPVVEKGEHGLTRYYDLFVVEIWCVPVPKVLYCCTTGQCFYRLGSRTMGLQPGEIRQMIVLEEEAIHRDEILALQDQLEQLKSVKNKLLSMSK